MQGPRSNLPAQESLTAATRRRFYPILALVFATSILTALLVFSNGTAVASGQYVAVGAGSYQDTDPNVVYENTWTRVSNPNASGGTFSESSTVYATASLVVSGAKSFQIMGKSGPRRGIAKILIDGQDVGHWDTFNSTMQFGVLSPVYTLPDIKSHKISIQVSDVKNAASSNYYVGLDQFIVNGATTPNAHLRRVNVPYFGGSIPLEQTAVFWLGKENADTSYTDIRVGYNSGELLVNANVMDRLLWYNENSPAPNNLTSYDSVSLYLSKSGTSAGAPDASAFRFDTQFTWWESDRTKWQAAYRGTGTSWSLISPTIKTESAWRGNRPDDTVEDRGWVVTYHIPFSALGLSGPPAQGTIWGLGVRLHNRNDSAGTAIADQMWPEGMSPTAPTSWGQLRFGLLPAYHGPSAQNIKTATIRHHLNGQTVTTTNVGGYTLCGTNLGPEAGARWWNAWGVQNWVGKEYLNVMNQDDPADWACYDKVYANFPLALVPSGKAITSAKLTFYQFGHAGQGSQRPGPSLIQAFSTDTGWNPATINWNNAPSPTQNLDRQWAGSGTCTSFVNCPAVTFDVSQAVADAYQAGQPLRVILYDTDTQISSGKYFFASETGDWNAANRPVLKVTYGDPQ